MLIQIVMNTLEAQFHRCRPLNQHMQSPIPSRSRGNFLFTAPPLEAIVAFAADLSTASVDLEQIQEQEQSIDSQGDDNEPFVAKPTETVSAFSSDADDEDKEVEAIVQSPKSKAQKSEALNEDKKSIADKEVKIESPKSGSVCEDKAKDKSDVKSRELNYNKSELILPNYLEKGENISRITDENEEKTPYHPPVQRANRQLSPKTNRPKIQRMEALEGSLKLKKSKKESKESVDKQSKAKEPEVITHNSLSRMVSADERLSAKESGHKVLRNTNSSDSSQSKASKSTWTIEVHSPVKLQPILPVKPPQERLLPIGINTKEVRTFKEVRDEITHYDRGCAADVETKSVQTFKPLSTTDAEMQYPVCERLLPIGPTPPFARKEQTPISPLIQQKRSAIVQTSVLKEEVISKCDTGVPPTVTNASNISASVACSATTYAIITTSVTNTETTTTVVNTVPTSDTINPKSPLMPRDSIDNIELKPKPPNSPVVEGLTRTVKTSDSFDSITSPKKEKISKSNSISVMKRDSKAEFDPRPNDDILEKVIVETPCITAIDKSEDSQSLPPNISQSQSVGDPKPVRHYRQRKTRKIGSTTSELQRSIESRGGGVADKVSRRTSRSKRSSQSTSNANQSLEELMYERCSRCGHVLEQFSEEEIGMCIIILGTYVHREPALAAPILPEMLRLVSKYAGLTTYQWQNERSVFERLPKGSD